jgi:hypothetical protein
MSDDVADVEKRSNEKPPLQSHCRGIEEQSWIGGASTSRDGDPVGLPSKLRYL